jgi:hypothetical protein
MYSRPALFSAWVAVTPAVVVNDSWLLGYEAKFAQAGGQLEGRRRLSRGDEIVDVVVGRFSWQREIVEAAEPMSLGDLSVPVARPAGLVLLEARTW